MILQLILSIFIMRFYIEFPSQSKRIEETVLALRIKELNPSRHKQDRILRHSTTRKNEVIYDMNSYASKHESSYIPSHFNEFRNHRKSYEYEESLLMGKISRPYQVHDTLYLEIR